MKIRSIAAAALLASTLLFNSHAGPLNKSSVSGSAKWVLHLDMEALGKTKAGSFFIKNVLEPKLAEFKEGGELNFQTTVGDIQSITAYGPGFDKESGGVLMVRSAGNTQKDLEALGGLAALSGDEGIKLTQGSPFTLYSVNNDFFIAPDIKGTVVLAKSRDQIDLARGILTGKGETMANSKMFSDLPNSPSGFFFLGMAEGFNETASMPPQAQVLKQTSGGRLVLGENADKLFLNLVLRGKTAESTTNIQQILQGIIALVRITQKDPDVTLLANSAKISSQSQNVTVNLEVPVSRAIEKIREDHFEGGVE